jgi:cysteinylglycine-S-conjugate dipeptidase
MHDERGDVSVAGLRCGEPSTVDYPEDQLRVDAGLLDDVELIGSGSLADRLWTRPTVTVTGIDMPSTGQASNTLQAHVRAKLSVRVAPGQPAAEVFEAVTAHLRAQPAWGAHVRLTLKETGEAFAADAQGPAYDAARSAFADAWGVEPVDIGVGGSIPFIAEFAEYFPKASILVTGVEDPDTRAHGIDESLHLGEFEKVCVAEAVLLERLAALPR